MLYRPLIIACMFLFMNELGTAYAESRSEAPEDGSTLELGGTTYTVKWQDGDSFRVLGNEAIKTRVTQFNTLESYGPVHRWGDWTGAELKAIADRATTFASKGHWSCTFVREGMSRKKDGYGRSLVRCDDLALALVKEGLAHVLLFKNEKADELVRAQQEAIKNRRGMWEKGVPSAVLTSLHSVSEERKDPSWLPYNRVGSTRTGNSLTVSHDRDYELCEEVCMRQSCLLYVPYAQRYGSNKAPCLQ